MARPVKEGLDYFPFDVDFAVNEKTEAIMGEFGPKGVLFMIYLLSAVYQNGYYLQWTKLKQMQLANRIEGLSPDLANQIVNRLIAYGTFSEELFNSAKVLTSPRIQETYLDATKRRKTPKPTLYWINVDINSDSTEVTADSNTQSKVKESKGNKSKQEPLEEEEEEINLSKARTRVFKLWKKLWDKPNAVLVKQIGDWLSAYKPDLVEFAIEIAAKSSVPKQAAPSYLTTLFDDWQQHDASTVEQARRVVEQHDQREPGLPDAAPNPFASRDIPNVPIFKLTE